MGIRFYCPNGHRLNVKDFLAGKRGICPHCEVRFRIPRESEIPKGSPREKPGSSAAAGASNGKRRPKKSVAVAESFPKNGTSDTLLKSEPFGRAVKLDPFDEAPEAVWYVRPPAGGQYGPAKSEIMRRWVAEGRISADSLVWREGWTDWQPAGPLFPNLGGAMTSVPAMTPAAMTPAAMTPAAMTPAAMTPAAMTAAAMTPAPVVSRPAASLNLQSATQLQPTSPERTPLPKVTVTDTRAAGKKKSVLPVVGLALLILVLAAVLVVVLVTKS